MPSTPQTKPDVVKTVVRFLGVISMLLCAGVLALAFRLNTADADHIAALLTPLVGLASFSLGGLTGLLISTRSSEPADASTSTTTTTESSGDGTTG